jgi:hypothetical protein
MSSLRPKKGTAEYAEQCADDPSDFIDDEPEEGNAAAKVAVKTASAKVAKKAADTKEKRFQAAIAEKAVFEAAQKEIADCMAKMSPNDKGRMRAAMDVVAASPAGTKCKYDHETATKRLIANTAPARILMETLKDDYESVNYMGSLCVYWKSRMPLDRAQTNEHVAFMKHFNKERHLYGLPEKAVSEALGDLSINEDEGAGAD